MLGVAEELATEIEERQEVEEPAVEGALHLVEALPQGVPAESTPRPQPTFRQCSCAQGCSGTSTAKIVFRPGAQGKVAESVFTQTPDKSRF